MKKIQVIFKVLLCSLFMLTACQSRSGAVWEDTKTASRYLQRKGKALFGKNNESRMLTYDDEFCGPVEVECIPLADADLKEHVSVPQPKTSPGEGRIPSIDMFIKPMGELASIFKTVHFNTDEHILRDENDNATMTKIAKYLKKHKKVVIFIAGHCDERASEAYNLALGTRRSNFIREQLVKNGVDLNQIYTTSYGKGHPVDMGHTRNAWKKNRRAEFKLYDLEGTR